MRIACLQFAPQVGDIDNNLNRADAVLNKAEAEDLESLDLLVLPEMAFSGYNFKSLQDISPFLEPSGSGISSLWARTMALKYNTNVIVGYPEKVDISPKWPTSPEYYDSAIMVNNDGETVLNYRKSFLYDVDETWALESNEGFYNGDIPSLGNTCIGICMDLNPYRFQAPWHAFEFAFHILESKASLVIVPMSWLTREESRRFSRTAKEPDMETLAYWVERLEPVIRAELEHEVIIVFCNRSGKEGDALYAGTSAVIGIKDGEVNVYGLAGRGTKELLVVDTNDPPCAKLVQRVERPSLNDRSPSDISAAVGATDGLPTPNIKYHSQQPAEAPKETTPPPSKEVASGSQTGEAKSPEGSPKSKKDRPSPKITIPVFPDPPRYVNTSATTAESPSIPTPTGPSPIPTTLRPKLTIPDPQPRYQHKPSPYPHDKYTAEQIRIFGNYTPITTPFANPEPPSAKYYCFPADARIRSPLDYTFKRDADSPTLVSSLLHYPVTRSPVQPKPRNFVAAAEKDISAKSDRSSGSSNSAKSSKSSSHGSTNSKANDTDPSSELQSPPLIATNPPRPSSPKSRNASRARGERRRSEAAKPHDAKSLAEKLEQLQKERPSSAACNRCESSQPVPLGFSNSRNSSQNRARFASATPITDPVLDERLASLSRCTIPIAASPSIFAGSNNPQGGYRSESRRGHQTGGSPELARPPSRTAHRTRSRSQSLVRNMNNLALSDGIDRTQSRTAVRPDLAHLEADESRPASRGRQRWADKDPSPKDYFQLRRSSQPTGQGATSALHRRNSGRRQSSANSMITFTRHTGIREATPADEIIAVEEYIDPECLLHNRRSSSASPTTDKMPSIEDGMAIVKMNNNNRLSPPLEPCPFHCDNHDDHPDRYNTASVEISVYKAPSPFTPHVLKSEVKANTSLHEVATGRPHSDPGGLAVLTLHDKDISDGNRFDRTPEAMEPPGPGAPWLSKVEVQTLVKGEGRPKSAI